MQNMFTHKTLLSGLTVAVVIGGIVIYSAQSTDTPPANLDTVSERAVDIMENEPTSVATVESTTSEAAVVTVEAEPISEPAPEAVAPVAPKPAATTPVVVTPTPAPVTPAPAPQATPVATGITKVEVAAHANEASCWSIINGGVYDLTSYVPRHPGGKSEILAICGKDGTRLFEGQHGGDSKPERILSGFFVDNLAS